MSSFKITSFSLLSLENQLKSSRENEGSFLQTPFWAEFKSAHGWKNLRFCINYESECQKKDFFCEECSVLIRSFGKSFLNFSIAYVPIFPSFLNLFENENSTEEKVEFITEFFSEFSKNLRPFLPKNTVCIKIEPDICFKTLEERNFFVKSVIKNSLKNHLKINKNKVDIQPPDSNRVYLCKTEEEILLNMKSKWRYNIRLSEKKGVNIEKINAFTKDFDSKLDEFYDLYKITAQRDGIAIHEKNYYKDLICKSSKEIQEGKNVPEISLYIARHENDSLAAIITLFSKTESVYLYGCSSNVKRNLMPNFLLQWNAIKDAKSYGSLYYDMYGIPPSEDENHPMHGLYLFKTGFGGQNIHRPGTFDIQLKFFYKILTFAENARSFWHKKILKKIRGR